MDISRTILYYIVRLVAVAIVISCHEFAHGLVAYWCGDKTAKINGRLTLNPIAHINIIGFLMMIIVGFGWANPVPIDSRNFKHLRRDYFFVSIAGVTTNIILAILGYFGLFGFSVLFSKVAVHELLSFSVLQFFAMFVVLNITFFVFNLLPFYPLDGFRALEAIVYKQNSVITFLRVHGGKILMGLLLLSLIADWVPVLSYIDILGRFMSFATNKLIFTIDKLVSLVL